MKTLDQQIPSDPALLEGFQRESSKRNGVLVLGAGVSGLAVCRLLAAAEIKFLVVDEAGAGAAVQEFPVLSGFRATSHELDRLRLFQPGLVVCSPGINLDEDPWVALKTSVLTDVPVTSEVEFAHSFLGRALVGVTGTNGKTTIVELLGHILSGLGCEVRVAGNVGIPLSSLVDVETFKGEAPGGSLAGCLTRLARFRSGIFEDSVPPLIVEYSSYQLEASGSLRPSIAICTNIADDHLERHGTFENYLCAKKRIFSDLEPDNWAIGPLDNSLRARLLDDCAASSIVVQNISKDGHSELSPGADQNWISVNASGQVQGVINSVCLDLRLPPRLAFGSHNRENASMVVAVLAVLGFAMDQVEQQLESFNLPRYRLEYVEAHDGIVWINDSKSTNPHSTFAALSTVIENYSEQAIYLILAGEMKRGSWASVLPLLGQCECVLIVGAEYAKFLRELGLEGDTKVPWRDYLKLEDAIDWLRSRLAPGDVVLFSPGAASFDSYANYLERGQHFSDLVLKGASWCYQI